MSMREILEKDLGEREAVMVEAGLNALGMALFAAQANGLIRFPAGNLTVGEITDKAKVAVEAGFMKFMESKEDFIASQK